MIAYDLFCGAGGAAAGLCRAGFFVTGFDIKPQPNYPFACIQGDALTLVPVDMRGADIIWASSPCQHSTAYRRRRDHVKPCENLIAATRDLLRRTGKPYTS